MTKIKFVGLILAVSLLAACTPSQNAVQTAIAQTQAAIPAATQIPFSLLHLDDVLIQENDLPAGISGAQIDNGVGLDLADYYLSQDMAYQDQRRGWVQVFIYEDTSLTAWRYGNRLSGFASECAKAAGQCHPGDPQTIFGLGEDAKMIDVYNMIGPDAYTVAFYRCHAVVEISIWSAINDSSGLITYAKRLDERLKPIVCR